MHAGIPTVKLINSYCSSYYAVTTSDNTAMAMPTAVSLPTGSSVTQIEAITGGVLGTVILVILILIVAAGIVYLVKEDRKWNKKNPIIVYKAQYTNMQVNRKSFTPES